MNEPEPPVPSAYAKSLMRRRLDMREALGMDAVAIALPASQCRNRPVVSRPGGPNFTWPLRNGSRGRLPHCKRSAP